MLCIQAMIRFLRKWSKPLQAADPKIMIKLLALKLIVALEIIQHLIWNILLQTDTLTPSRTMSYNDLHYGIMSTVLSFEAMVFGIVMLFTYWPTQNRRMHHDHVYSAVEAGKADREQLNMDKQRGSPVKAFIDTVNLVDIVAGIWRMLQLAVTGKNGRQGGRREARREGRRGGRGGRFGRFGRRDNAATAEVGQVPPSYEQERSLAQESRET
jgi:hypothetical protein